MQLTPGQRLMCSACETELIVVKAPEVDVEISCDGEPVTAFSARTEIRGHPGGSSGDGALLGKRYSDESSGLEVLCTRQGQGLLSCSGTPLAQTVAKPLPSSD